MAYVGQKPVVGNFRKCDALTASATDTYNLTVNSVAVVPGSVNQMVVSLNGVIQSPTSAYTISGSQIIFDSALTSSDVIDFILIYGDILDVGTVTDSAITTAKLASTSVTSAKLNNDIISGTTALTSEPADTDEFLVSDAGTLKRIDYSLIKGGGSRTLLATTTVTSAVSSVDFTSGIDSTYPMYEIIFINVHTSGGNYSFLYNLQESGAFKSSGNCYEYANQVTTSGGSHEANASTGANDVKLHGETISDGTGYNMNGIFRIFNPSATDNFKAVLSDVTTQRNDGEATRSSSASYYQTNQNAITGVRFKWSTGNIATGIFKLYGVS